MKLHELEIGTQVEVDMLEDAGGGTVLMEVVEGRGNLRKEFKVVGQPVYYDDVVLMEGMTKEVRFL